MLFRFVTLILLCITISISAKENVIHVAGAQSKKDVIHDYYHQLLTMALNAGSSSKFKLKTLEADSLTQARASHLLANNSLDVFWMGTSIVREKQFYPIKIPLLKGLLGYRSSIIKKQDLSDFSALTTTDFKQKTACQAAHWPDTKILEHNKYNVYPVNHFDVIFEMVSKGRCDYFPRAILEGYGELAIAKKSFDNLTMLDDILLYYPFPIYFFVNKDNAALGHIIEAGLEKIINNGEFDLLIKNHRVTKHAFPLEKWKNKKILHLENPFLAIDTDTENAKYWVPPINK